MESDAQHAEAISTMYAELFPAATFSEDALKQRSDDDLRYLFRASQLTSIYTADPDVVHDTALAFAEMQRRNIAKKFDYQQMYGAFIRSEEHTSELQSLMRISYA